MISMERPDGAIIAAIGKTRSGKSHLLKELARISQRCLVFCPKGEYASQLGFEAVYDKETLLRRVVEIKDGPININFVASTRKDFDFYCGVAWICNMYAMCVAINEELAMYTNTGKSEGYWNRLVCQGLATGIVIGCTVQRGQEVDKTVMNNATVLHILQHQTEDDQAYIAGKLGLQTEDIPNDKLKFLQWAPGKGVIGRGRIDFPKDKNGRPRFRGAGRSGRLLTVGENGLFKQFQYT